MRRHRDRITQQRWARLWFVLEGATCTCARFGNGNPCGIIGFEFRKGLDCGMYGLVQHCRYSSAESVFQFALAFRWQTNKRSLECFIQG